MGEVIKFPVEKVVRSAGKDETNDSPARILMFEGVRYSASDLESGKCPKPSVEPSSV